MILYASYLSLSLYGADLFNSLDPVSEWEPTEEEYSRRILWQSLTVVGVVTLLLATLLVVLCSGVEVWRAKQT